MTPPRTCPNCRKAFVVTNKYRPGQRYCSRKCQSQAFYAANCRRKPEKGGEQ